MPTLSRIVKRLSLIHHNGGQQVNRRDAVIFMSELLCLLLLFIFARAIVDHYGMRYAMLTRVITLFLKMERRDAATFLLLPRDTTPSLMLVCRTSDGYTLLTPCYDDAAALSPIRLIRYFLMPSCRLIFHFRRSFYDAA